MSALEKGYELTFAYGGLKLFTLSTKITTEYDKNDVSGNLLIRSAMFYF